MVGLVATGTVRLVGLVATGTVGWFGCHRHSARVLHMKTEEYASRKVCNGLAGETTLAAMPQLRAVLDES